MQKTQGIHEWAACVVALVDTLLTFDDEEESLGGGRDLETANYQMCLTLRYPEAYFSWKLSSLFSVQQHTGLIIPQRHVYNTDGYPEGDSRTAPACGNASTWRCR